MNFPKPNSQWPPKKLTDAFNLMAASAKWWEGNPSTLESFFKTHPTQYSGGVVGKVSRFFWGSPNKGNTKKLHAPLPADIVQKSAALLFETAPNFSIADNGGNDAARERIDLMLNTEDFVANALIAAESCAALGGVYGKIVWSQDISETPWVHWVEADSVLPEWKYGRLVACTFVEELAKQDKNHVWRLFSRHIPGYIEYSLYQGDRNNVGIPKPLDEHPDTIGLIDLLEDGYRVPTGADGICAVYIPNARPNVSFRHNGQLRPLGRPDISEDLFEWFDMLDEAWTSLKRDLRVGGTRITVPEYMLKTEGFGQGKTFDYGDEVFTAFKASPDSNMNPTLFQPTIRVEEHLALIEGIVRQILQRANYSPMSFGMDTDGVGQPTAREITARNQETIQTWRAKTRYWRFGLQQLAADLLAVDNFLNNTGAELTKPIQIDFQAPSEETLLEKAQTVQALDSARAISTEEKVAMVHPEWDDNRKQAEVELIKTENALPCIAAHPP